MGPSALEQVCRHTLMAGFALRTVWPVWLVVGGFLLIRMQQQRQESPQEQETALRSPRSRNLRGGDRRRRFLPERNDTPPGSRPLNNGINGTHTEVSASVDQHGCGDDAGHSEGHVDCKTELQLESTTQQMVALNDHADMRVARVSDKEEDHVAVDQLFAAAESEQHAEFYAKDQEAFDLVWPVVHCILKTRATAVIRYRQVLLNDVFIHDPVGATDAVVRDLVDLLEPQTARLGDALRGGYYTGILVLQRTVEMMGDVVKETLERWTREALSFGFPSSSQHARCDGVEADLYRLAVAIAEEVVETVQEVAEGWDMVLSEGFASPHEWQQSF